MTSYGVASLGAMAAASAIALGAVAADGAAVALALSGAAPLPITPTTAMSTTAVPVPVASTPLSRAPVADMTRHTAGGWLLRVMTETAPDETLCPLPGTAPAEPDSL